MNAFFFISIYSLDSLFTIGRSRLNSMSRKEMPVKSRHCVIFRYLQLKGWEPLMKPITNYRCILISAFNWKFNFRYYILLHILKYILTWYIMKCRHILRMKTFFLPPHQTEQLFWLMKSPSLNIKTLQMSGTYSNYGNVTSKGCQEREKQSSCETCIHLNIQFVKNNRFHKTHKWDVHSSSLLNHVCLFLRRRGAFVSSVAPQRSWGRVTVLGNGLWCHWSQWNWPMDYCFMVFLMVHLCPEQGCRTSRWPK